ncbi:MAG: hypothetical protein HONDAALG_02615 [Gammaproteobacteria bacterium]|nr:hypothetical protein [Gammaproteobacteria bacterium]
MAFCIFGVHKWSYPDQTLDLCGNRKCIHCQKVERGLGEHVWGYSTYLSGGHPDYMTYHSSRFCKRCGFNGGDKSWGQYEEEPERWVISK